MVYATFTDEMKQLLSNAKGACFVSYECEKDEAFSRAYDTKHAPFAFDNNCFISSVNVA